jgi:hypothetical protein
MMIGLDGLFFASELPDVTDFQKEFEMARVFGIAVFLCALPFAACAVTLPPHTPGTICVIADGWCWAAPTGSPGDDCVCPTSSEWAQGTLG